MEEGGDYSDREYGEDYTLGDTMGAIGPLGASPGFKESLDQMGQTANVSCLKNFQKFLKLIL